MDLTFIFCSRLLILFLCFKGFLSVRVSSTVSNQPVLGGSFTLQCSCTLDSGELAGTSIVLKRYRQRDSEFSTIVSFPFVYRDTQTATYVDTSLESRTVATKPENTNSSSVSLQFYSAECDDAAQYKWIVTYRAGVNREKESSSNVTVKVESSFTGSSDFGVKASTNYDVQEGTNVTFTCKANVGNEPKGDLVWYYYLSNPGVPYPISNLALKKDPVPYKICSYSQESTLNMNMTPGLNAVIVRCTVQQDFTDSADGDDYRQTNSFNISYSPRQTTITSNPYHPVYSEGEPELNLTCSSASNPVASFFWLLPNGSEVPGRIYQLHSLQINNTGNYTCVAKNGVPNENYADLHTIEVIVVEKTTTTTTTPTTTPSTLAPKNNTTKSGALKQRLPQTEEEVQASLIAAPIGGVLGTAIVISVLVVVAWKKRLLKDVVFKNKKQCDGEKHIGDVHNYVNMDSHTKVSSDMISNMNGLMPYERLGPREASSRTYEKLRNSKQTRQEGQDSNPDVYYNIAAKQDKAQQQHHTDCSNTERKYNEYEEIKERLDEQ